jgi:hypothetical protein
LSYNKSPFLIRNIKKYLYIAIKKAQSTKIEPLIFGSPGRTIVRTFVQPYFWSNIKGLRKVASGLKHKINYPDAYLIMISTLLGK